MQNMQYGAFVGQVNMAHQPPMVSLSGTACSVALWFSMYPCSKEDIELIYEYTFYSFHAA